MDILNTFTNHVFDDVLQIYHAQSRFYDPNLRRFISPDPFWNAYNRIWGDNPNFVLPCIYSIRQAGNLYSYVLNNPLKYTDPTGLSAASLINRVALGALRDTLQPNNVAQLYSNSSNSSDEFKDGVKLGLLSHVVNTLYALHDPGTVLVEAVTAAVNNPLETLVATLAPLASPLNQEVRRQVNMAIAYQNNGAVGIGMHVGQTLGQDITSVALLAGGAAVGHIARATPRVTNYNMRFACPPKTLGANTPPPPSQIVTRVRTGGNASGTPLTRLNLRFFGNRGVGGKGWRGDATWKKDVNIVRDGGTIRNLDGRVPTQSEAIDLIKASGGTPLRIEGAHNAPNPHNFPHINYTTPSGAKGTIQIIEIAGS